MSDSRVFQLDVIKLSSFCLDIFMCGNFSHFLGLRPHGLAYIKHYMGPIPVMVPVMLPSVLFVSSSISSIHNRLACLTASEWFDVCRDFLISAVERLYLFLTESGIRQRK